MNTIAKSIIAKRFGAMLAIGLAGAVLAGSVAPAAAGKHGGGKGGHHHGQQQPKPPKVTSQPMPLPPPVIKVVRDHRTPKPAPIVRDHRAQPVIRDHRAPKPAPVVRDHRAPAPVATNGARPRTTTVKVAGVKILTVKSKGKACVGSYCL